MWDIAGQERFGNMTQAYYRGAIGAFIVYDVTRPLTFQNVLKWKNDIDAKVELPLAWGGRSIPVVLLANKIDQHPNPKPQKEMEGFCRDNSFIQWFETSAKENTSIDTAAEYLINHIVQLEMSKQNDSEYEVDYSSNDSTAADSSTSNKHIPRATDES
ncbi:RAS-related protein Rab-38 [Mucor ambiguus]|uniref:RAS-related protein Rab-38 n=1 Tax=Mucor ambiguus TaxID=91626 RepID=A0A0C9MP98_9FUNG|nr:RAS-related protein Rab-38 [Mucor ambiguus]